MIKTIFRMFCIMLLVLTSQSIYGQNELTFEKLKNDALDFLVSKNELKSSRAEKFKSGEFNAFVFKGLMNEQSSGKIKNGLYIFYLLDENSKYYFTLIEGENSKILDIGTRKGLDNSIKLVLDYCERNRYCVNLINEYIPVLIKFYYSQNKFPMNGHDRNCEDGVKDEKQLP